MFGFSLAKFLLTILVIAAVWFGWRAYVRYQALKNARAGEMPKPSGRAAREARVEAEDMVECRSCGAFIALTRRVACGRKDCPFPG